MVRFLSEGENNVGFCKKMNLKDTEANYFKQ